METISITKELKSWEDVCGLLGCDTRLTNSFGSWASDLDICPTIKHFREIAFLFILKCRSTQTNITPVNKWNNFKGKYYGELCHDIDPMCDYGDFDYNKYNKSSAIRGVSLKTIKRLILALIYLDSQFKEQLKCPKDHKG